MRDAVVVLPALIVLIALRLLVHPVGTYAADLPTIWRNRSASFGVDALKNWTVGTFGGLFVLSYLTRRNLRTVRLFGAFLVLVYGQLLIAGNTERLLVLAFPVFILMSIEGLRWQTVKRK